MGIDKNRPQLWDGVWDKDISPEEDLFNLLKEENGIRWQRIEKRVIEDFGSFVGLRVVEIGSGAGTNAALMAKRGAHVTVLDYSEKALQRAREFFERNGLSAEYIQQDALALPDELLGRFDVCMSFGLTEHFTGEDRVRINKAHFDVLRDGGLAFISVPNKFNPPYRLFKFAAEKTGRWSAGEEYPYSRRELRRICRQIGVTKYEFFGDSLVESLRFVDPVVIARKLRGAPPRLDISRIRRERGTALDQYLSYALVLAARK